MVTEVYLDKKPKIDASCFIHESSYIIGDVKIAEKVSVWPYSVLRGDVAPITIGKATNIQDGTIIHGTHAGPYTGSGHGTIIGNNVTVGHRCILHACTIEDNSFIGMNTTILDRAVIETGAMLGANSLVTSEQIITSGYLWLGQPARKIRKLTTKEKEYIKYSAKHYINVAENHTRPSQSIDK
jgi:carbonic anhydrase/acetyltransferase-like protein (isoleucine patch superfamily)